MKKLFLTAFAALALCFSTEAYALWGGVKEADIEKTAIKVSGEVIRGGYKTVSTEELKGWLDGKKDMLIVDTLPTETSYKKNHIPGAVNLEFTAAESESLDDARKDSIVKALGGDKDRTIVFYCGETKCGRSHNGALWAVKLGYRNIYRYPGGIKAWMEAGYQVESGK